MCCIAAPKIPLTNTAPKSHISSVVSLPPVWKLAWKRINREAEKAQPQVGPHPGLHPADAPDRNFLPCAQEAGNQHEEEADDSADQPESPAPADSLWSAQSVSNEYSCGQSQYDYAGDKPFPV